MTLKARHWSNGGHGELPHRRINEGLVRGALVHCGFDNDAGGHKLWAQVEEVYPVAEAIVRERPRPWRRIGTTPCALRVGNKSGPKR